MNEQLFPKRKKLRWRWDGENGEHVTFQHPETFSLYVLNPLGAKVFYLSDGEHSVGDIIDQITAEFEAPSRETVASDVSDFLDFMGKSGIIMHLEA